MEWSTRREWFARTILWLTYVKKTNSTLPWPSWRWSLYLPLWRSSPHQSAGAQSPPESEHKKGQALSLTQCNKIKHIFHWTYLVYIWSNQVIQFVQNAVNDFNQQMALLIFQGGWHEQGQDLIEQGACSKFTGLICDLTQGSLERHEERLRQQ